MRGQRDIDDQLNKASDGVNGGSMWPGRSYEQGVENALRWVTGEEDVAPMDEDD